MPKTNKKQGFVLLVVMMGVAALSVMVWLQTDVAVADRLAAVSVKQDTQARAIAERCLQEATTYARHEANRNGLDDFDLLLDPDDDHPGTAWSNTMFQPINMPYTGTSPVVIHDAAVGNARAEALHRYTLVPLMGGACLIRFDDNNDDSLASANFGITTNNGTSTTEGSGAEEELRGDRDRAMIITSIGIFPYNGVPAGAYQRARSRVTMKSILQTEVQVMPGGTPALSIGGNINGSDGVAICGLVGGLSAPGPANTFNGSRMCSCGITNAGGSAPPACVPGNCQGPWVGNDCAAQVDTGTWAPAPPPPLPQMEWPSGLLAGMPGATPIANVTVTPNLIPSVVGVAPVNAWITGAAAPVIAVPPPPIPGGLADPVCDFWFGSQGASRIVFYWDHLDPNASATVPAFPSATQAGGILPADDCTTYTGTTIPRPCTWTFTGFAPNWSFTCAAGESLCWKPVGGLGGPGNVGIADTTESTQGPAPETFKPTTTRRAPYSYSGSTGVSRSWTGLCGAIGDDSFSGGVSNNGGQWEVGAPTRNHWGANGSRWFFDNAPGSANRVDIVGELGQDGDPISLQIIARSAVNVDAGLTMNAVCPGCTPVGGATCDETLAPRSSGHFLWAPYGHCALGEPDELVGDITCRTIQIDEGTDDECLVSDLAATGFCLTGTCSAPDNPNEVAARGCFTGAPCDSPSICVDESTTLVGDINAHGDVQLDETLVYAGEVVADQLGAAVQLNDMCIGSTAQVFASDFIFVREDLKMDYDEANLWSPNIYIGGTIDVEKDQSLRGWNVPPHSKPDADVFVGGDFNCGSSKIYIEGRLRLMGNFVGDSKKIVIRNDDTGGAAPIISVQESSIWTEQPW